MVSLVILLLLLSHSLADGDAGSSGGSGHTYLQRTENKWDGKTAWFTGSSKQRKSEMRVEVFCCRL